MALGYLMVAILAAAVAVFALQNGSPAPVRFITWTIEGLPLAALILASLASGLVVAGVPLLIQRWRLRARLRAAERRVAELESAAAKREAGLTPAGGATPPPEARPRPSAPNLPQAMP
jgi:uncharacterized integral membrane protein